MTSDGEPEDFLPLKAKDYHILFALLDDERYGYDMARSIEERTGGRIRIEPANLYRRVRRLMSDGLVEEAAERCAGEAGGERRRYYRLTPLGRRVVAEEVGRMKTLVEEAEARRILPGGARPT